METGAVLHAPSAPELAGWKVQRTVIGMVLLVAAAIGIYLGIKGALADDTAGDGAVMVTFVTIGASGAIGFFGLRYLLLGVLGKGVTFYERAVEADFQRGFGLLPKHRTVPLLHIRVSGSSRLTHAQAITTTGHAFRLPPVLVERSDIYYLGSLGTRPIAPGGEMARDAYMKGELEPYSHPTSDPLPDHGPAWPDPGTLPITVDVPVEPEPVPAPPADAPPSAPIERPRPEPVRHRPPPSVIQPAPTVTRASPPLEPEMEVVMDLPDVVAPPETPIVSMPPPPMVRPSSITMPEPPEHKLMDREEELEEVEMLEPIAPPVPKPPPEPAPEPAPMPTPEPVLEEVPPPSPPPPAASDGWELEELPPPEQKEKKPAPPSGWDWEEL